MRIGIVCPYSFDQPGGVQAHVLDLGSTLIAQGHDVQVLGPATQAADVPEFVVRGGRSIPIPYNGSVARLALGPQVIARTKRFIREGRFDLLHIHEPNSPSYSLVALALAHGPIVATYHASASTSAVLRIVLPFLRPSLEKIRGSIAVSELARRWQVEMVGGDPVLIPNGVDISAFNGTPDMDPPEIVFLGRLDEPRKGLDIFLDAVAGITQPVKVTVIGAGDHRRLSSSSPPVEFVGRVSDVRKAEILGRASIYVAPNTGSESFGIVLVEAMAARCAVVASDLEAFRAVCGSAGHYFPTGNAVALRTELNRLLAHPEERRAAGDNGRRQAEQYDWSHVSRKIMAVYETVVNDTKVTA